MQSCVGVNLLLGGFTSGDESQPRIFSSNVMIVVKISSGANLSKLFLNADDSRRFSRSNKLKLSVSRIII